MKVNPNDNSIKTSFCFDANNLPALVQQLEENFQNVVNKIENIEITGDSDHKVALDEADDLDEGAGYLHEKLTFHGEYVSDASSLIYAESGAVSEDLFLIWATEPGYAADGDRLWASVDGVVGWQAVDLGGALDNFTVMVTSDDNTPSYLYDAMYNHQTINDPSDLVVAFQVAGTAGTDQKLIAFVDTSAIVGYHESERRYLGVYEGISQYMTSEQVTSDVIEVIVEDGTFVAAIEKFRAIRGQAVGNVDFTSTTFSIDNVVLLDGSKDPRSTLGSTSETVTIHNIPRQGHLDNLEVYADYNANLSRWEARPAARATIKAKVTTAIPKATGPAIGAWGRTGIVRLQDQVTGAVGSTDVAVDNDNINSEWSANSQVTLDPNYYPLRVLGGSCSSVTGWLS